MNFNLKILGTGNLRTLSRTLGSGTLRKTLECLIRISINHSSLVKYTVIYSRGEYVNKCQSEPCLKYDREHNFDVIL